MASLSDVGAKNDFYYSHSYHYDSHFAGLFNRIFAIGTLILLACTLFVFQYTNGHYVRWVEGASMYPTLNADYRNSDTVYVSKASTGTNGDIIVTTAPDNIAVIKRLIARGGDTLRLEWDVVSNVTIVYVNGEQIKEPYTNQQTSTAQETAYFWTFYNQTNWNTTPSVGYGYAGSNPYAQITIPTNYVFYMGDNRGGSYDCRSYGPRHEDNILGKVNFVVHTGENLLVSQINIMIEPVVRLANIALAPVLHFAKLLAGDGFTEFLTRIGLGWAAKFYT